MYRIIIYTYSNTYIFLHIAKVFGVKTHTHTHLTSAGVEWSGKWSVSPAAFQPSGHVRGVDARYQDIMATRQHSLLEAATFPRAWKPWDGFPHLAENPSNFLGVNYVSFMKGYIYIHRSRVIY